MANFKTDNKKVLGRDISITIETLTVLCDYLKSTKGNNKKSFRTYCEENKLGEDRYRIQSNIKSLGKFVSDIEDSIELYYAKVTAGEEYEDSIYELALDTIYENVTQGTEYNNGFCYDIIDYYAEFGKYKFLKKFNLLQKASKRSKNENTIISKFIGSFGSQFFDPEIVSRESLLKEGIIVPVLVDGIKVKHEFTAKEKEKAVSYMEKRCIPLNYDLFRMVLNKFLLGSIVDKETNKVKELGKKEI